MNEESKSPLGKILTGVLLLGALISSGWVLENNPAGTLAVKQSRFSGDLTCHMEPGVYLQGFGTITEYPRSAVVTFTDIEGEGGEVEGLPSIPTRFSGMGTATVEGAFSAILPVECPKLLELHKRFGSMDGITNGILRNSVRTAVLASGTFQTATENATTGRNAFIALIGDQLEHGIIQTRSVARQVPTAVKGEMKTIREALPVACSGDNVGCFDGMSRKNATFADNGILVRDFNILDIKYDEEVTKQIAKQRASLMDVETKQAEAKQARADAAKAQAQGEADVARTKAKQAVISEQTIAKATRTKEAAELLAQQREEVAKLNQKTATLDAKSLDIQSKAEADAKRRLVEADGGLAIRVNAYTQATAVMADAIANAAPGVLVPQIVMGGGGEGGGNGMDFLKLLAAGTASDLALNLKNKSRTN